MTRCEKCRRRLTREPIRFGGMTLGPKCAVVLGYVPPAPIAGAVAPIPARREAFKRIKVKRDEAQPDFFADDLEELTC